MSLEQAPKDVQLAVDLIYLLESNEIDPNVALAALKIVEQDLERRLSLELPKIELPKPEQPEK
ncbi:pleiotropic regulatory protein RsmS [Budvicia diplopodorum]|uniref:pleiotropic regulatory protein RsmS n=1 Tax=Budvicia diplopodorum TaxID=1119056 RepID=UPI001359527F|nr:pleiotropic regulatory protein RsmS [Budvicia diplopodorum]